MVYSGLMSGSLDEKKFEARVPPDLWEQYEQWAEGRAKIGNRQLLIALLRLFLRVPEWARLLALYGKEDQLADLDAIRPEQLAMRSETATAGEIVDNAVRRVQSRRSAPDRPPDKTPERKK